MFYLTVNWFYVNFSDLWDPLTVFFYGFLLIGGMISLGYCYRYGPIRNQKAINLIEWSLKIISLVCIYFGTSYEETSISLIIVVVSVDIISHLISVGRINFSFLQRIRQDIFCSVIEIFFA